MRGTEGAELLDLWERASGLDPTGRLRVLATVADGAGLDVHGAPLGRVHARLLSLRVALAGPDLAATTSCPACGEPVEFALDADALLALAPPATVVEPLELGGWHVVWRPLTLRDVEAAAEQRAQAAAEVTLLSRCVEQVKDPDGKPREASALPDDVRAALAAAVADADPLVELLVRLTCPQCGRGFGTEVDVGAFVWVEVEAAARRLLLDVDRLARAYGWTEAAVLQLSDRRRAAYLHILTEGNP